MPRRSNDCSAWGVVNKFNQLGYMTKISHGISTGNKLVDKQIAKYAAKAVNLMDGCRILWLLVLQDLSV